LCCDETSPAIQSTLGAAACNPDIGLVYPDATQISNIIVKKNCQTDGSFEVSIIVPVKHDGNCMSATCIENGCTFYGDNGKGC
jgi:hypothetical protein